MTSTSYDIKGMDCADCARKIEKGIRRLEHVDEAHVDFMTGKLHVAGSVTVEDIQSRVEDLGYELDDSSNADGDTQQEHAHHAVIAFWRYLRERDDMRFTLIGGGILSLTVGLSIMGFSPIIVGSVSIIATLLMLYPIARSGINNLRINHDFNINLLMTIAVIGAIFIGEMLEAAAVIFLFTIGEALEGFTTNRARESLRSLMALAPSKALVLRGNSEHLIPVEELAVGDEIIVKPGERIPMDGRVTSGESGVNQAPITGESLPVHKTINDEVFAGSINGDGLLHIEVTRLAEDNTLSRIIQLVEQAQSSRAPTQRLIDRFAHYYTPAVVVVALLIALIPPLLFDGRFLEPNGTVFSLFHASSEGAASEIVRRGWLYRALVLLVIACPCALVISTPVTIISAIMSAARHGVLIKGGAYIEALGQTRAVAFDKTGTLTTGKPIMQQVRSANCEYDDNCSACNDVLALASAVERRAVHPLAEAIVSAANSRGVDKAYAPAQHVEMLAGRGVRGVVNQQMITVGSHALFDEEYAHSDALHEAVNATEAQGQTTMMVAADDDVRGYIAVADAARDESLAIIDRLQRLGIRTVMLTGDNATVGQAIGREIGVDDVRAGLLPGQKADAVKALLNDYGNVTMVGDGINDTPALATATVGVAMGGAGSAQALETADIALMADGLTALPFAIELSRFARRLIRLNMALSLSVKAAFIGLAIFGVTSLWLAILADVGVSLLVTLNGMRPLRMK